MQAHKGLTSAYSAPAGWTAIVVAWITEAFTSPPSAMLRKVTFSSVTLAPGNTLTPGASFIVKLVTVVPASHAAVVVGAPDERLCNGKHQRECWLYCARMHLIVLPRRWRC